jgi:acetylornithine deacetylase/succinyl-diaminopimelate desuccinylase-like protein
MGRKIVVILEVVFLWLILGCQSDHLERNYEKNDLILKALGSVSKENIYKTVEELQKFETRYSWEKQDEVANYLFQRFQEYGIPVEFDEYYFRKKKWKNVIATIKGKKKTNAIYMVIAHFDSISKQPEVSAPGADDNGSGTAAVLEIGRVLKEVSLNATVKLGIFSNEEQGGVGSKDFARKAHEKDLNIRGVINLDIIGYNDPIGSVSYKLSEIRGMMGTMKLRVKKIRNHILRFLYPDGIVVIAGRPPNKGLVKTASALTQNYSKLKVKAMVGKDCG